MPKHNPVMVQFNKADQNTQLKAARKALTPTDTLPQITNELSRVNPTLSIRKDGRIRFVTDTHIFKN